MDDKKDKRPTLGSAESLKGRKAKTKRKLNKWLTLLICVVVIAAGFGVYYGTDILTTKPGEEAGDNSTTAKLVSVPLIEKEARDFDRLTVYQAGNEPYTIVSNLQYDEEGNQLPNPTYPPEPGAQEDEAAPEAAQESPAPAEAEAPSGGEEVDDANYYPNYSVDGLPYFTLTISQADSLVTYAKSLTAQDTIEEDAKDLSAYGLNDPEVIVEYEYRDGTRQKLMIGNQAPIATYCYAMLEGDNNVYIIYNSVKTAYNKTLNSMHTIENPVEMDESAIEDIVIEQKGKETIELKIREDTDAIMGVTTLQIVRPIVYDAHSTRAQEMLTGATSLTCSAYAGHYEDEDGKAEFGLNDPNIRLYFKDSDGKENTVIVGNKTGDGFYYVTVDKSGDVYTMSQASLSFVENATVSYLVDQFTNLINILNVDEIKIEVSGDTYTMHIESEADPEDESKTISTYFFDGEVRDETSFKKIYTEVIGLLFDRVSDDYHHDGETVAKLTYKFNNEWDNFVIEYLNYDRDYYAILRDGQTLFLIKREKVDTMIGYLGQYREGTFTWN